MTLALALYTLTLGIYLVIGAIVASLRWRTISLRTGADKLVAAWIVACAWPLVVWGIRHPASFRRFARKGQR